MSRGFAECVGVGVGVGVGLGFPAVGAGTGDGVGPGCEGTGKGLDAGRLITCPPGVAAGATCRGAAEGVVAVVVFGAAAAGAAPGVGVADRCMSKPASGSAETPVGVDDGAVSAEVSGMEIGVSWPTQPADDAVPSRPVLAAIAPAAAVSVRPMAPAAAAADLLRIMVASPSRF